MMSLDCRTGSGMPPDGSPPSEAWLYAQAISGNPIPRIVSPEAAARAKRQELQRLAQFSARHAEELRKLDAANAEARHQRELLEWAAGISTRAEDKLRELNRKEAAEREGWRRAERFYEMCCARVIEWNEADHRRQPKGTPHGGEWARQDGVGAMAASQAASPSQGMLDQERVLRRIQSISGENWSGDRVLDSIGTLAPGWLPFIHRHVTLSLTSAGSTDPVTTVRSGEFGPAISDLPKAPLRTLGPLTVHIEVPNGWNDIQVARFILNQLADDLDVHRLAADWATSEPRLFKEIKEKRFKDGLTTIAALAGGYYTAIASLVPGGQLAVAAWDIQEGDKVGAALDIAFMLPLAKLAKAGSGAIAIKAGDKLVGVLPFKAIEQVGKLATEQKALLHKRLLAAKTEQEAAEIVAKFVGTQFDRHHPIVKFLGGDTKQLLERIPKSIHEEFHALLREELRNAGFALPIGTKKGSREAWLKEFGKAEGAQGKAFDSVLKASRTIDEKYGTELTQAVWKNLVGGHYFPVP